MRYYIYCFVAYVQSSVPVLQVSTTVSLLIPVSLGHHITAAHLISSKYLVNTELCQLSSPVLKVKEGNVNIYIFLFYFFYVHGSVHCKSLLSNYPTRCDYKQFLLLPAALHVSGGNSTHHQEHIKL
jgi:hypothetical protein